MTKDRSNRPRARDSIQLQGCVQSVLCSRGIHTISTCNYSARITVRNHPRQLTAEGGALFPGYLCLHINKARKSISAPQPAQESVEPYALLDTLFLLQLPPRPRLHHPIPNPPADLNDRNP